ncbi:MAG: hypothetical protein JWN34_5524 [Bryobacterales bacterium]|nr:hypothetical protein [Bryobacterales bacterium]
MVLGNAFGAYPMLIPIVSLSLTASSGTDVAGTACIPLMALLTNRPRAEMSREREGNTAIAVTAPR